MKISQQQIDLLDSFTCERLSYNHDNLVFLSKVNIILPSDEHHPNYKKLKSSQNLLDVIKKDAWSKDSANSIAYYIVKDKDDDVAMIFSLQNGCIYDSTQREEIRRLYIQYQVVETCIRAKRDLVAGNNKEQALNYLHSKGADTLSLDFLENYAKKLRENNRNLLNRKISDIEKEHAIYYAGEVHSGIELHIFWKNPNYNLKWETLTKNLDFPKDKRMGEIFFWYYVIDKLEKALEHSGCKYMYLFAADTTDDGNLIAYYNDLGFLLDEKMGTIKPVFDYSCKFMYQEIGTMISKKRDYFDNFILEDEIIA